MYKQIDGMMGAEEAADALVFNATNIANAIKRRDNICFEGRATAVEVLMDLLAEYVAQERAAALAAKSSAPVAT